MKHLLFVVICMANVTAFASDCSLFIENEHIYPAKALKLLKSSEKNYVITSDMDKATYFLSLHGGSLDGKNWGIGGEIINQKANEDELYTEKEIAVQGKGFIKTVMKAVNEVPKCGQPLMNLIEQ